jgi:WD40 repeat protein
MLKQRTFSIRFIRFALLMLAVFLSIKNGIAQEPRREFRGFSSGTNMSVNCDGHWLLVNSGNDVELFHTRTGLQVRKFSSHKSSVNCVAAHPRKRVAISGDENGQIYLWNMDDLKIIQVYALQGDAVKSIRFNKEGSQFAAVIGSGNQLRIFDLMHAKHIGSNDDNLLSIEAMDLNEIKSQLFTAHDNGTVGVWSVTKDSLKKIKTWKAHEGIVTGVQTLRNGNLLTVGKDRAVKLWDAAFKNIKNYIVESSIVSIAVSSDQKMAALALGDGKTIVIDIATGLIKFQFETKNKTKEVLFHPTEPLIITLYNDNVARSWLVRSEK